MKQTEKLILFLIFVLTVFLDYLVIQPMAFGKNYPEMIKERGQGRSAEKGITIPVEFPDVRHHVDIKEVVTSKNRATLAPSF